jgi:hypothetical protein
LRKVGAGVLMGVGGLFCIIFISGVMRGYQAAAARANTASSGVHVTPRSEAATSDSQIAADRLLKIEHPPQPERAPPPPVRAETPVALAEFDTARYCARIAQHVGGSYQIEEHCRGAEADAKARIEARDIPARVQRYCTRIGETVGGSYQIMNTCVDSELAAKAKL